MNKNWKTLAVGATISVALALFVPAQADPIPTSKCFGKRPTIAGRASHAGWNSKSRRDRGREKGARQWRKRSHLHPRGC